MEGKELGDCSCLEGETCIVLAALIAFFRGLSCKKEIWVHTHGYYASGFLMLVFFVFCFKDTSPFCSCFSALQSEHIHIHFKFPFMCSAEKRQVKNQRNYQILVILFLLGGQGETQS